MNADEIKARLLNLGIVTVPSGFQGFWPAKQPDITSGEKTKSWSDWRDLNKEALEAGGAAKVLDGIAMKQMLQGNAQGIDPTKTISGLLGILAPNLSGATELGPPNVGAAMAQKIGMATENTGLLKANSDNAISKLAEYYTGRVEDVLGRISASLEGIEGITDEDDPL
jgi:hypothetical protein